VNERRPRVSYFLRLGAESRGDCGDEAIPAVGFLAQTLEARSGELVELGPAVVVGCAPARFEKSLAYQAIQGGIERALFDKQGSTRNLLDAQKYAVTMERAERDGLENEEIESAGKELSLASHASS
jgi:hypothetical protein